MDTGPTTPDEHPDEHSDEHLLGGRYALGAVLGRGGMADVHRAHDTLLDRDVAIKMFRRVDLPTSDLRRAGEVQMLASMSHPGLVTVFDAGRTEDGDFGYLVLELIDGPSLRDRLDEGRLDPAHTARIGAQVAAALAYVHSRGVVHRDVKPANILLAPDGSARLTDFGVARLLDATQLTVEGMTVGTANYLSPEQATGASLTGASDVYTLGLVLLECLTGELAFPGSGVAAAGARLHRDPDVPAELGTEWVALLTAMTARDPSARPPADSVAARLAGVPTADRPTVAALPVDAPTELLVAEPAGRRRPGLLAMAIAGTAAAIVALAAVLALTAGSDGTAGSPTSPTVPPSSPTTRASTTQSTSSSAPSTTPPSTPRSTSSAPTTSPKPPAKPPHKPKPPKKHKPPKKPHKLWSG